MTRILLIVITLFAISCDIKVNKDSDLIGPGHESLGTKLVWDEHTGDIQGFKVYVGVDDANYEEAADINNPDATEILITDLNITLDDEQKNYIYLTAYNASGESDASGKVCWGYSCP